MEHKVASGPDGFKVPNKAKAFHFNEYYTLYQVLYYLMLFAFWPPHHPHLLLFSPLPFKLQNWKANLWHPFCLWIHLLHFCCGAFLSLFWPSTGKQSLHPCYFQSNTLSCVFHSISVFTCILFIDSLFNGASSSPRMEFPEGRIFVLSCSFRAVNAWYSIGVGIIVYWMNQ